MTSDIDQTRITTNPLPSNWVGVTYFPHAHGSGLENEVEIWRAPVVSETETHLTIAIYGEPVRFPKGPNLKVKRSDA